MNIHDRNNQENQNQQDREQSSGGQPPQQDQNKIEHHAINLPKGGGAIRGIEEKFQANAVTGTGSYSIPLPASPGRSGFSPQLSLSYDSGSGNSAFGLGWDVAIPSITRKAGRELPQYKDYEESDTFILSGAEDLVPLLESSGERKIIDDGEKEYLVYPYRPRIEGLFAKIEKLVHRDSQDTFWKATTKDNITSIYGENPMARLYDPQGESKVFKWCLEKSFDAKGNVTVYEYKREDHDQVDQDAISSIQRYNQLGPCTNLYLKGVKYSPFVNNSSRYHFQMVFDYGEHDQDTPLPDDSGSWSVRQDPFSSYRSGFDIRTYRLCKRVLMFHNFTTEDEDAWELVRGLNLEHESTPIVTYLTKATQIGFKKVDTTYESKSLPAVEYLYSKPEINKEIQFIDGESLKNLPVGIDNQSFQWIDVKGEGIAGIAIKQDDAVFYKPNLGGGTFGELETIAQMPELRAEDTQIAISDVDGDGYNELVVRQPGIHGFYRYRHDRWENFTPFEKNLTIDWDDPNLRMVDLNGDGRADVLITENHLFRWYPSDGEKGYDASKIVPVDKDEQKGPALVFSDVEQSIYLADMSGDGLTDIVRIRNGEVCYWPNLGYGTFGPKVIMANSPLFNNKERIYHQYIKLGDIDGSGTTDIFYFGNDTVEFWFNQSGNGFSEKQQLSSFPDINSLSSVSLIDLMGNGTLCLVWSTNIPGNEKQQMCYIDLMGGEKPHLMKQTNNNMGQITKLTYASSSKSYIEDKLNGKKWITSLHFPVQVIDKIESIDLVGGSRLTTEYRYHHGYFDAKEQEFRGFGMVESIDTETFEDYENAPPTSPGGGLEEIEEHYVAPILTKTWFHTGSCVDSAYISKQYENEYFLGDEKAFLLPDTVIENSSELNEKEIEEAFRALKSSTLRQEIYEYGVDTPYQVTETNFKVKNLQSHGKNKHAVFFTVPQETITFHYEQNREDPRIAHELVLDVDDYGNLLKSCSVVYPRRGEVNPLNPPEGDLGIALDKEQGKVYGTLNVNSFVNVDDLSNDTDRFYLIGVPTEVQSYEIGKGLLSSVNAHEKIDIEEFKALFNNSDFWDASNNNIIKFHESLEDSGNESKIRLLDWNRTYFWNEDQDDALDNGEVTEKALLHHVENAVSTPELIASAYDNQVTSQTVNDAGYVLKNEYYWNPGLVQHHSIGDFYLPVKTEDPFGGDVTVDYDDYSFIPIQTTDSLNNTSIAQIDYRTLQPWKLTDPNGNSAEAITDSLGMVIATTVYGTELGVTKGDTPISSYEIRTEDSQGRPLNPPQGGYVVEDVLDNPEYYLQEATSFFYYDLEAWPKRQEPVQFVQIARETHVSDLNGGQTKYQKSLGYSDGFGRELQSKVLVEPGKAWVRVGDVFEEQEVDTRWLVSGRTVYNNKQKPIKQYEPFYSATHAYEDEEFFAEFGVTPIIHYDPLLRVVRTDSPKGFHSKVIFTPWEIMKFDENDTVENSQYYIDNYNDPSLPADEKEALDKALVHKNTPQISHLDTLGREFMVIDYLAPPPSLGGGLSSDDSLVTHTEFNITGQPIAVTDPRQYKSDGSGIKTFRYTYDMSDQPIRTINIDAGDDRAFVNVMGNPVYSFDAKAHAIHIEYDILQRPIKTTVTGNGLNNITERLIYGESESNPEYFNLRGQVSQQYDQAGFTKAVLYSFKGEPKKSEQKIRSDYKAEADWQGDQASWNAQLEDETFETETTYDALGRVIVQNSPDGSVTQPEYHQSGKLNKVQVQLKNEGSFTEFVKSISYNAKGQREEIVYGNNTKTDYTYEKETFRLKELITTRTTDSKELQNIAYVYDPVGNITSVTDLSHERVITGSHIVEPKQAFTYDALYRLISANGREHKALNNTSAQHGEEWFNQLFVNINDSQALANYTRNYVYDKAGNLKTIQHTASDSTRSFTRNIKVANSSNRAVPDSMPNDPASYFDDNGNLTELEHIAGIDWNYRDNIAKATIIEREDDADDAEYYIYDSSGQRVRKVKETVVGSTVEIEEKIYLGGVEIKRIRSAGSLTLERSDLHVMDDTSRIAIVNYWELDANLREVENASDIGTNKTRYQFGNHLGSSSLELNGSGELISYEEYFPFGGTSFTTGNNQKEVKLKEYRYTGKERDNNTGLYYYGARYYASWIGRWLSCDPKIEDGLNLYVYVRNNPIKLIDPDGRQALEALTAAEKSRQAFGLIDNTKPATNLLEFPVKTKFPILKVLGKIGAGVNYSNYAIALNKYLIAPGLYNELEGGMSRQLRGVHEYGFTPQVNPELNLDAPARALDYLKQRKQRKKAEYKIYLHGFLGRQDQIISNKFLGWIGADKKGVTPNIALLWAGHVGVSFDSPHSKIYGFLPETGGDTMSTVLDNLFRGKSYPGKVGDDTIIFRMAEKLGYKVLTKEFNLTKEQYAAIRTQFEIQRFMKTPFKYSFPPKDTPGRPEDFQDLNTINCALWPQKIGVAIPAQTGKIKAYMEAWKSKWGERTRYDYR